MTRLTRRNPDGTANFADANFESVCAELTPANREKVREIVEKLAESEDAEQDGRSLIKAAKEIAEFCDGMKDCDYCPFFEKTNNSCALDDTPPSAWDVWGMSAV